MKLSHPFLFFRTVTHTPPPPHPRLIALHAEVKLVPVQQHRIHDISLDHHVFPIAHLGNVIHDTDATPPGRPHGLHNPRVELGAPIRLGGGLGGAGEGVDESDVLFGEDKRLGENAEVLREAATQPDVTTIAMRAESSVCVCVCVCGGGGG